MCGIAGHIPTAYDSAKPVDNAPRITRMLDALAHRGPDGRGLHIDPDTGVALGHVRLSIIDLTDDGAQPMFNEDRTIAITYNGEVYNYPALRDELVALGHAFKSHTDTEVLVHGYEQWGIAGLLDRLRGMFAFAIYDKPKGLIHLARATRRGSSRCLSGAAPPALRSRPSPKRSRRLTPARWRSRARCWPSR
ncbi:hypothetical protein OT109_11725 [Phycisphaeraceae bacterium D3-23]